eukprot:357027-Chlamydomonas_euryale.AAC.3
MLLCSYSWRSTGHLYSDGPCPSHLPQSATIDVTRMHTSPRQAPNRPMNGARSRHRKDWNAWTKAA